MITIKKAQSDDFMAIAKLDAVVWNDDGINRNYIADGEHAWRKWVDFSLVYYAENKQGEKVAAIVAFPTIKNGWCIHKLFVAQNYRQLGIAKSLMQHVLNDIDRLEKKVFLTVAPANACAINLYELFGFKIKKLHHGFYRDHEDRYMMKRPVQWADAIQRKLKMVG